jgi:hypothetical protein
MKCAGKKFFSGTGFTGDQYTHVAFATHLYVAHDSLISGDEPMYPRCRSWFSHLWGDGRDFSPEKRPSYFFKMSQSLINVTNPWRKTKL